MGGGARSEEAQVVSLPPHVDVFDDDGGSKEVIRTWGGVLGREGVSKIPTLDPPPPPSHHKT